MSGAVAAAAAGVKAGASQSMFDNLFEHCHWDNAVFTHGMFWVAFLIVTYAGTLYYKWKEAKEQAEKDRQEKEQSAAQQAAKRRQAPLIQPLAKPIEKKIEVPVVVVDKKAAQKVKKAEQQQRAEPVQMMPQSPPAAANNTPKGVTASVGSTKKSAQLSPAKNEQATSSKQSKKKQKKAKATAEPAPTVSAPEPAAPVETEAPYLASEPAQTLNEATSQASRRRATDDDDWNFVAK